MSIKMSLKKASTMVCFCSLCFLAIFPSFLKAVLKLDFITQPLLALMIGSALLEVVGDGKLPSAKVPLYYMPWIIFMFLTITGFRVNFVATIRIWCCILLGLILRVNTSWIKTALHCITFWLSINVFATWFFFLFPNQYDIMIRIYGGSPSGTQGGIYGYRAGIANHYSQNGMYISFFLIILFMMFLGRYIIVRSRAKKRNKKEKILIFLIILAALALLLTSKRAILIWMICSIIFTYMISTKEKITTAIKIIARVFTILGIVLIIAELIPAIGVVFDRFKEIGSDSSSLERLALRKLAITKFLEKPIFGNGFWSFRVFYEQSLSGLYHVGNEDLRQLDAHNVFIQVLCELGIVGFICYIISCFSVLIKTIRYVRFYREGENALFFTFCLISLCIQIYCLFSSITGNVLYDVVFFFYAFALAIILSIDYQTKKVGIKI